MENQNMTGSTSTDSSYLAELEDAEVTSEIEGCLKKYHINLDDSKYMRNPNYGYFLTKHINHKKYPKFNYLTYDYYIDKIILPQRGIDKTKYLANFDMGNQKEIPGSITCKQLIDEIKDTLVVELNPDAGKDGEDLYKNIYKKLFDSSKKGGLLKQFEGASNINLSDFNDEHSKFKFLKLLYKFSKTDYYGKKINFHSMFQSISFTNVDRTIINNEENNGKYISLLKNELLKEIPLVYSTHLNIYLSIIRENWDKFVKYAQDLLFEKKHIELDNLAKCLEAFVKESIPTEKYIGHIERNMSLFEVIYLWVLQYEWRCAFGELIDICIYTYEHIHSYDRYQMIDENRFLPSPIKKYILYHQKKLAELLVTPDFDEKDALDLIEKSPKYIMIFINWMIKLRMIYCEYNDPEELVTFSFMLSSLIAMRDAMIANEANENTYYGAHKSGKVKLMSKISKSEKSENIHFQYIWLKKISYIETCILLFATDPEKKLNVEISILKIMQYLYSVYNIEDLKNLHDLYYKQLESLLPNFEVDNH